MVQMVILLHGRFHMPYGLFRTSCIHHHIHSRITRTICHDIAISTTLADDDYSMNNPDSCENGRIRSGGLGVVKDSWFGRLYRG